MVDAYQAITCWARICPGVAITGLRVQDFVCEGDFLVALLLFLFLCAYMQDLDVMRLRRNRWDRGASHPHTRFRMHYTPWKDCVFVGVRAEDYPDSLHEQVSRPMTPVHSWPVRHLCH